MAILSCVRRLNPRLSATVHTKSIRRPRQNFVSKFVEIGSRIAARQLQMPQEQQKEKEMRIQHWQPPSHNVPLAPHLVVEAIQAIRGEETVYDVRWSAPISSDEMRFVEDYVQSRYPHIYMETVVGVNLSQVNEEDEGGDMSQPGSPAVWDSVERQKASNKRGGRNNGASQQGPGEHWKGRWAPSGSSLAEAPGKAKLNPSRLAEILEDRTVSMDNSMSVTEIHARNRILQRCGVDQSEYHVVFTPGAKEALMLVGEAYPFCKHNVYMTAMDEEWEVESQFGGMSQFATFKESKVIPAPLAWLDLRIAGSQLSTNFRRKSKSNPKGLFAYPVQAGGLKNSLHWVSEAQRNLWHVLLDASEMVLDEETFDLGQHKPDYLVCVSPKIVGYPTNVTCLLIRRSSQLIEKTL